MEARPAQESGLLSRLLRLVESPATRIVAVAVLLVLVATAVDSGGMQKAAADADWSLIWPALAMVPLQVLAAAVLWRRLALSVDPALTLAESTRAVLGSLSVSIWTPARAGDFAARPTLMPRGSRRTLAVAVGAENLLRLPVPLLLAAGASWMVPFPGHLIFAGVCLVTGLAAALLFASPRLSTRLAEAMRVGRHAEFLATVPAGSLVVGHGLRYGFLVAQFGLVALAMSGAAEPGAWVVLAACCVILAAKLVAPLLNFAELGIREGASLVALGAIGFSAESALQASLVLYAINVLLPAAVGAFFWLRRTRDS